MFYRPMKLMMQAFILLFGLSLVAVSHDAYARAGSKRSFGQRSYPSAQPRSTPPTQNQQMQPPPANRGSFMKGLAGGMVGGLLGGMLFSSLAQGAGFGGLGGGFGFLDLLLIAGLCYAGYRFWKHRKSQAQPAFAGASTSQSFMPPLDRSPLAQTHQREALSDPADAGYYGRGLTVSRDNYGTQPSLDREAAEDIFFRIQGAFTRRDLAPVMDYLERDVAHVLRADLQELRDRREINRLENISVRHIELSEPWMEGGRELVRVRFTASMLDYVVDEQTESLKSGSATDPVKFDEYWIFARAEGAKAWQLAGIEQI